MRWKLLNDDLFLFLSIRIDGNSVQVSNWTSCEIRYFENFTFLKKRVSKFVSMWRRGGYCKHLFLYTYTDLSVERDEAHLFWKMVCLIKSATWCNKTEKLTFQ